MKVLIRLVFTIFILAALVLPVVSADEDSVVAVFSVGRAGGVMASGFAAADGTRVITVPAAVTETVYGKKSSLFDVFVVSRVTGDIYSASVAAVDEDISLALLTTSKPAAPGVKLAPDNALSYAARVTLGQLLSGEDVGGRFPTSILGFDFQKTPPKYVIKSWRGSSACISEIKGRDLLFLSKVTPDEKPPKSALVMRSGQAIGVFQVRVFVEGGEKPVVFYRVTPVKLLRQFLRKSGIDEKLLSSASGPAAADGAESAFQSACSALTASLFGSPQDAFDKAAEALKSRPKNVVLNMLQGAALIKLGKTDDAVKALNTALEIDPNLTTAKLQRGIAYIAAGKNSLAEGDLRAVLKEQPNNITALFALIAVLSSSESGLPECVQLLKDAERRNPDDFDIRIELAKILKKQKDYDGAIERLKFVVEKAPNRTDVRAALASSYEASGKPDLAEAQYRKIVELEPKNPDAYFFLIDYLISAGKIDDAKSSISEVRKLKLTTQAEETLKKLESKIEEQK